MKWLTVCVLVVIAVQIVGLDPVVTAKNGFEAAPQVGDEPTSSTTPAPACQAETCEDCISSGSCYFCQTTKICAPYPVKHIIPPYKNCTLGDVRWGVCWMNFKVMIITVSVLAGVLIISIIICCCCCCRKKKRSRLVQDDAKREREKEERRIRGLERQKERQSRNDEIRRKYGLIKDDHPYQKFDSQNS